MESLRDALGSRELHAGLFAGLVALVVTVGVGVVWMRRRGAPAPIVGIAIAAASLWGWRATAGVPAGVAWGLTLLVAGGVAADVLHRPVLVGAPIAVPGALLLAQAAPHAPAWCAAVVAVTVVLGGALVAAFDTRHARLGAAPALLAVSFVGVYVTVPDTEQALVLVGAGAMLLFAAWPRTLGRLGTGGSLAAVGALAWAAAVGGTARPASIVGAVAALGVLIAEPIGRAVVLFGGSMPPASAADRLPPRIWSTPALAAAQAVVVLVVARVAGTRTSVPVAVAISGITLALVVVAAVVLTPRRGTGATTVRAAASGIAARPEGGVRG